MKVIHLNITENYGGAAKAANRLHHELINFGIDSKMYVLKKYSNDENIIEVPSLYTFKIKTGVLFRKLIRRLGKFIHKPKYSYDNQTYLFEVLKKTDFDILHLHWITDGFVNFRELTGIGKPVVWTMHDCAAFTGICHVIGTCENYLHHCGNCTLINSGKKKDVSYYEFLRKLKLFGKIDFSFVSPSKWLADTASNSPLLKNKKIRVIPHGIDISKYVPIDKNVARKALQFNENVKIVLCGAVTLGDSNKGFNLLSEAISCLRNNATFPYDFEVVFFGEDINELIEFPVKTSYLGYVMDERLLGICYAAADLVVVPSRQEAFGLIALEAMACGTPVVAFGATGLLDIVEHKKNGYLAVPYDTKDFATGIAWCLENNNAKKLSENARKRIEDSFDISKTSLEYVNIYKSLVNGR